MSKLYEKGDVVRVDLGMPPNQVIGSEQGKTRPCMVLSNFGYLKLAIIAPFTGSNKDYLRPTSVSVPASVAGLTKDSMIMLHQIRSVSHDRILERIGSLPENIIGKVDTVLNDILDL